MAKYIAFLRAINIGKRRVKMDKLKSIFESLGFKNVKSYIASGNMIFETDNENRLELKSTIEESLNTELGYKVDTFLRTIPELKEISDNNPFAEIENSDRKTIYISIFDSDPSESSKSSLPYDETGVYTFKLLGKELYTLRDLSSTEEVSVFSNNYVEKILKLPATTRNINTVFSLLRENS